MCWKNFFFTVSFTSLNVFFVDFSLQNMLREVGRKVVMGPVFSIGRGFLVQLCIVCRGVNPPIY